MPSPYLVAELKQEEACELTAYKDTVGVWTIGYGHTGREVHPGLTWTQDQADNALAMDINLTCRGLDSALPWWRELGLYRQDALVDMAFNLGVHGLLEFNTFLDLMKEGKFLAAAVDLKKTEWAGQVKTRAVRLEQQISSGQHYGQS